MGWWSRLWGAGGDQRHEGFQNPRPKKSTASNVGFDDAMSMSAFWAAARLLTEVVAAMPIVCYERTVDASGNLSRKRVETYLLWKVLSQIPNQFQTGTEFIEAIMLSLVTNGNFYGLKQTNSQGEIIGITPLVASQMDPILMDGSIIYQYTESDKSVKVFAADKIWHIKLFGNGIVGLSPMGYASRSLGIALAADERVNTLAKNGGKATGILTVDGALTEQQRLRVKENFKGLEDGDEDGLFVLEAGFQYHQTSLSPADTQLIQNRRFQVEDIARFMGVPSVLINDTAATTTWGSGIEQITQGFYKLNLRPYLERIESSIKRWLMPATEWDKYDIEFDFDSLLRADFVTRMEAYNKGINSGMLAPNEGRANEGLGPKEGGDKIYLNGSLVPAGETRDNSVAMPAGRFTPDPKVEGEEDET